MTAVLAVDVGGTKLAAGLVVDGELVQAGRAPTPVSDDAEEVFASLVGLVDRLDGARDVAAAGVGCGGPMRWPQGEVSPLNIPAWRGFPLRERVAALVPTARVVVHNDAVAFALAEARRGAVRRAEAVLGVVVSTGVGGGIVRGGRAVDGPRGQAGHVGHVVAEPDGPLCACGARGCLEAVARGPAVVARALAAGWEPPAGDAADGRALAAAAADGDEVARAEIARAGAAVGRVVAGAAALLDLDAVVVGGGFGSQGDALWEPMTKAFEASARLDYTRGCLLLPSTLGDDAGLLGAAALVDG